MNEIERIFTKYKDNCKWIQNMEEKFHREVPIEQWSVEVEEIYAEYKVLFDRNTQIAEEIMELLTKELSCEDMDRLYKESVAMYEEYIEDGILLYRIYERLIVYYETIPDNDKLVILHSYSDYVQNDIIGMEFNHPKRNTYHSLKVLNFIPEYVFLGEKARFRIFTMYYNLIIACTDSDTILIDEAFSYYYDMLKLWNREDVQALDGKNEKINGMVEMVKQRVIVLETKMPQASKENQEEFCRLSRYYYQEELKHVSESTEMDMMVYVAYLRAQILTGEKTLEENFDQLVSYYREQYYKVQDCEDASWEIIFYLVRTCTTIVNWMQQGIPGDKMNKIVSDLMMMLETKWKKYKMEDAPEIDDLLVDFVNLALKLPLDEVEKKRYAFEFGIRRQELTYVNAVVVRMIVSEFLQKIFEKDEDIFGKEKKENLQDFAEDCALFHNLGNINYRCCRKRPSRKFFSQERIWLQEHVKVGAECVENAAGMQKFRDVMLYHHKFFDGKGGYPEECDNTASENKAVTDLISIAEFIESYCNVFFGFSDVTDKFKECLMILQKGKDTRFHGKMVDLLLNSKDLQEKIVHILTRNRKELVYSQYHRYAIGMTEKEKEKYLKDTIDLFEKERPEEKESQIEKRVDQLFLISKNPPSQKFIGLTYYVAALCADLKRDVIRANNFATRSIHFLADEEEGEEERIAKLYNLLGIYAFSNGDYGVAVSQFLMCADYSQKAGKQYGIGVSYSNIANLFMKLDNPVKALEYIEKAEPDFNINRYNQICMLCYKGYCYNKLGELEKSKSVKGEIESLSKGPKEFPKMICLLFYAHLALYKGEKSEAEEYLKEIEKCEELKKPYIDYVNEQDIFCEILSKLKKNQELYRYLKYQIELCQKTDMPYHLERKLIRRMILCIKKEKRLDLVDVYGDMLENVFIAEDQHKVQLALESEYSALDTISLQKKHEEVVRDNYKLKEGLKNAESANEAKNAFLSSMSHEIRTPIHAVLGLDEMIIRETNQEGIRKYALDIQTAGKTLLGLVNDILDFSKLEAGKMELVPEEYLVKDMIRELDNMIASRAEQKKLSFHVKMNTAIPAKLYGDDLRIKQVILNLLTNAVKYTEKGSITFSVDFEKKDADNVFLKVMVQDTGIGLKPEEIGRLNKPFERLNLKKNRTIEGSGLGMSIVTNLLSQMQSKLSVESTYGVGSSFSFELEQKVIDWTEVGELNEKSGLIMPKKKGPLFTAPDAKILIVDDTAVNLTVVKGLLRRNKVQITAVKSGKECLEVCSKESFHLILLDHRMPEMDGVETLHYLREKEGKNQNTTVVALTANAITGAYEYYKKEGFDDLVIKPVNGQVLEEKVMSFLPKELVTLC